MQLPDPPTLTVVVPIYNVGSYLRPCLDSILAGTLTDLDVVCVDDGSTDGSGAVAESYAARDDRVRVLHVENGGLGRARNIGAQAARGRYLAFADSDDRVPADAYQLMCESLDASGSDLATGRVRRFTDTRSWWSGIHSRAIRRGARGTHISRVPTLVYDTTAWNKVFRRSFWGAHGLRFPEGVLYEDIHLMISAHVLAEKVDVLRTPVYEWRVRGDGSLSITQRRAEFGNMRDRFTAIHALDDFLIDYGDAKLLQEYHLKLLLIDFPLYLDVLDAGDQEYQVAFMHHMQRVLGHFGADTLYGGSVWIHVVLELLRRGRLAEALQVLELRRRNEGSYEIVRRGIRVYADLPYLRDRAVGVPDRAYDVGSRLPVHAAVEQLAIVDDALVVRGYALIARTHFDHPWSAVRYLVIRSKNTRHRIVRVLRPQHRPDLTAEFGTATGGYEFAGFETRIPLDEFELGDGNEAVYDVQVKILTPGARRGVPLGCLARSYLKKGPLCVMADGRHLAVYEGDAQVLRVAVDRDVPLVEDVSIEGGTLRCSVRLPAGSPAGARLAWHSEDGAAPAVTADLEGDTAVRTARIDLAAFRERPIVAGQRLWQASVETPSGVSRPVLSTHDFAHIQGEDAERRRELAVRIGRRGRLTLIDRAARCRVDELALDGGELRVGLLLPPALTADTLQFALQHKLFGETEPVSVTGEGRAVALTFAVID
ncbi:MAG TPA: glycosyltransferase, partial [Jatrophihabitantaceae bacterium]